MKFPGPYVVLNDRTVSGTLYNQIHQTSNLLWAALQNRKSVITVNYNMTDLQAKKYNQVSVY